MNFRISYLLVFSVICALSLAIVNPLLADLVFSDNFDAGTAGENLGAPWTIAGGPGTSGEPSSVKVQEDTTGVLFGSAGNKFAEFLDPRTNSPPARADYFSFGSVSSSLLKVSFDFHEASNYTITDANSVVHGNDPSSLGLGEPNSFNVQVGTLPSNQTARGIDFRLSNGKLWYQNGSATVAATAETSDYDLDAANHIQIIANFNALDGNYGAGSVASGFYDVWLDGALVADELIFRVPDQASQTITGIRFGTDNVSVQSFYIDNVKITRPGSPGDFNLDGLVDAADYAVWRKNTPEDMIKYEEWRTNFTSIGGNGAGLEGPPGSATTVPEPALWTMFTLASIGGALLRRRAAVGQR